MDEAFLSFLWLRQPFHHKQLTTLQGDPISVHRTGLLNTNAGPDFSMARLLIGDVLWVGNIELHLRTSYWYTHRHQKDAAYENVILHVVWENDLPLSDVLLQKIPTLALKDFTPVQLLESYYRLQESSQFIPCEKQFSSVPDLYKFNMLERARLDRLVEKAERVMTIWEATNRDWHQTAWQLLCRYWAGPVNAPAMEHLSERLPLKILLKHRDSLMAIEALLFGVSGLLPSDNPANDAYVISLNEEFQFLKHKYSLTILNTQEWKFARMRPSGFPTLRLAQLAMWIHLYGSPFNAIAATNSLEKLYKSCLITPSDYWQTHYTFSKSTLSTGSSGKDTALSIILNVATSIQYCLDTRMGQTELTHSYWQSFEMLPPEDNTIIRSWKSLGLRAKNAVDTQALLGLYQQHCIRKQCALCHIGNYLLKSGITN